MSELILQSARNLHGNVRPPGDKSISHRAAMLAALGDGPAELENYATGADCASTLRCLESLGVKVAREDGAIKLAGVGLHGLRPSAAPLDAGNSGSTIRMLSGILAAQPFATEIGGDESLSRRPMRRIIEPLAQMGARITAAPGERAPLRFAPASAPLRAINYDAPVASAQVKSAILLAALYAQGGTTVAEPVRTRDHTELLLRHLGVPLHQRFQPRAEVELAGPIATLPPLGNYRIPGDMSSAAFFLCAAAMFPGSDLTVEEVSLNPTRAALLDLLARLGAQPRVLAVEERHGELVGHLQLQGPGSGLRGATVRGAEAAALIDEIPILAVLATATRDGIEFQDVGELRVKESDRIAAILTNLRAMGAQAEERGNGFFVPGEQRLRGAVIQTHDDHRIAMAFAVAALRAGGETQIDRPGCAAISYPGFYATLERLAQR